MDAQWYTYVHEVKDGSVWNINFRQMKIFVPLHEGKNIHYLFYIIIVQRFNKVKRKSIEKQLQLKQNIHVSNSKQEVLSELLRLAKRTCCAC